MDPGMAEPRAASWAFFKPGEKLRCFCNKRLVDLGPSVSAAVRPSTGEPLLPGCVEVKCRGCQMMIEIRFSTGQKAA